MAVVCIVKFDFIYNIDYLTQKRSIFHILVQVCKCLLNNAFCSWCIGIYRKIFQGWKQFFIDEREQSFSCQRFTVFFIYRPIAPAQIFGDDGLVVIIFVFPSLFLSVIDFQEEHPSHLFYSLCVTIDTCILTHDILDSLYDIIYCHF